MYDQQPAFDIPQRNIVQRFFAQKWSAIVLEIILTIVISVAAGSAFDFFDPFDPANDDATPAALSSEAYHVALRPLTERGMAHIQRREYARAEAMYDLAIAVAPSEASFYAWRGYARLHAADYLAAQADYRQALDLLGSDYEAHVALCWAYGESRQVEAAMSHCQAALGLAQSLPQYVIALENRCWLQVETDDFTSALADCQAVLAAMPGCQDKVCALAHYNIGRVELAQGRLQPALRHFEQAILIGSDYAEMYLDIAKVYDTLGTEASARQAYRLYRQLGAGGA